MTDSPPAKSDKRTRLVAGATDLLHRLGVRATTIAEVAKVSDVPPGNVYYYFKTKSDLVRAVAASLDEQAGQMLAAADGLPSPGERLKMLARRWHEMRAVVARHGCPIGTLATELSRHEEEHADGSAPLRRILDWSERQMGELGVARPRELAVAFLAGIQGGAVLSVALRDPELMAGQVAHLEGWIDTLA